MECGRAMGQIARVKLSSTNLAKLDAVCEDIIGIGRKTGVKIRGPIPLPVKKMRLPTRKSPCGNGTETYEKWELRLHKRIIDINADAKALRHLIRLNPDDVRLEMVMT